MTASLDPSLEPGKYQLQPVALLDFVDEFVNGEVPSDGCEQALDGRFIAVNVEQSTNHLRCANGVDPLDIDLDGFNHAILVQVEHQVVDEVETIANDDERKLVGQLGLFEEVLDLLGVVVVAFAANPLNFADLASPCSSLNVLEVNFRILTDVHHRTEIVVETWGCRLVEGWMGEKTIRTFETLEAFKHLDEFDRPEDIRVLGRNLNDDLQVLADIDLEHLLQASH